MQEIENPDNNIDDYHLLNGGDGEPVLLPILLCEVSCGFPSPAEDYTEERIDILREIVRHPLTTYVWRAGGDSMRDRLIDSGTIVVFDRMIEPKSGDAAAVRIGGGLCVREIYIDRQTGRKFLRSCNENYAPIEVTEEMGVEILGKIIYSITKQ